MPGAPSSVTLTMASSSFPAIASFNALRKGSGLRSTSSFARGYSLQGPAVLLGLNFPHRIARRPCTRRSIRHTSRRTRGEITSHFSPRRGGRLQDIGHKLFDPLLIVQSDTTQAREPFSQYMECSQARYASAYFAPVKRLFSRETYRCCSGLFKKPYKVRFTDCARSTARARRRRCAGKRPLLQTRRFLHHLVAQPRTQHDRSRPPSFCD